MKLLEAECGPECFNKDKPYKEWADFAVAADVPSRAPLMTVSDYLKHNAHIKSTQDNKSSPKRVGATSSASLKPKAMGDDDDDVVDEEDDM